MPEVGDNMRRLTPAPTWKSRAAQFGQPRPELLLACVVLALLSALLLPGIAFLASRPDEAGAFNAVIEACQRGARRGPFAVAGYPAGVLLLGWAVLSILRFTRRALHEAWMLRGRSRLLRDLSADFEVSAGGPARRVRVVDVPGCVAFTAGLARPHVYVSPALLAQLEPDELTAVLVHEAEHCRRRDPLKCWLVDVLCATTWWPGIGSLAAHFRARREAAADRVAIDRLGDPKPLLRAIQRAAPVFPGVAACGITAGQDLAAQQVRLLGQGPTSKQLIGFAAGFAVVAALLVLAVVGLADWQFYWFCPDAAGAVA